MSAFGAIADTGDGDRTVIYMPEGVTSIDARVLLDNKFSEKPEQIAWTVRLYRHVNLVKGEPMWIFKSRNGLPEFIPF